MTNSWHNISKVAEATKEALANQCILVKSVDKKYNSEFGISGSQIGSSLELRYPGIGADVKEGRTLDDADEGAVNEYIRTLGLKQYHSHHKVFSDEMALNLDDKMVQVLKPLGIKMANHIDGLVANLFKQVPMAVGTPGTAITDLELFNEAQARMFMAGCNDNFGNKAAIHPLTEPKLIKGLAGLFNPTSDIAQQYKTGSIGSAAGLAFSKSQLIPIHTVGTIGAGSTPLVDGAVVEGATQIVTDGWASNLCHLNVGDIISVGGSNATNPITKEDAGFEKQYTVTKAVSDTAGAMVINVSPAFSLTGLDAVTALPADGAKIHVYGKESSSDLAALSGKSAKVNMVYAPEAFVFGSAPLPLPVGEKATRWFDKDLGISFRLIEDYDVKYDATLFRLDVLAGVCLGRHNWAVRVLS